MVIRQIVNALLQLPKMLIKYQALTSYLSKKLYSIYVLIGQEHYLLNDAALTVKKMWRQQGECEEKTIELHHANDWVTLFEVANSYSLFAERVLLDVRYEKKTIDANGKTAINKYLDHLNARCTIIFRAPFIPAKQLQWLINNPAILVIQSNPLAAAALKNWIVQQLQSNFIQYQPQVPPLIHQYTQGNMTACAQVIEKLKLVNIQGELLSTEEVQTHLIDQCDYQLYELTDACLNGDGNKAIHLLRQAANQRTEPVLILWLLTQEIRLLIQLSYLCKQPLPFSEACNQVKIWPQRANLYKTTLAHIPLAKLYELLQFAEQLDQQIKSNQTTSVWHGFERIALSFHRI